MGLGYQEAVEINRQFQDLHLASPSADWVLKQRVERDILLLYHQLANYAYVMGDLYYGDVFALPYWEYLDFPNVPTRDRDFIREGCLMMILAMVSEVLDGTGGYMVPHLASCRYALESTIAKDEDGRRLIETVRKAVEAVANDHREEDVPGLTDAMRWAHVRYVRGYFRQVAREFDENPYYATVERQE